jgi:hypothetical protein
VADFGEEGEEVEAHGEIISEAGGGRLEGGRIV